MPSWRKGVTLLNYIKKQKEVKFKGVNNDNKAVTIGKYDGRDVTYSINTEYTLLKKHTIYRTNSFDEFVKKTIIIFNMNH